MPKYISGQYVTFEGLRYKVICPVFYESWNCLTNDKTAIGWRYRLDGYRHDVEESQLSITPDELLKCIL